MLHQIHSEHANQKELRNETAYSFDSDRNGICLCARTKHHRRFREWSHGADPNSCSRGHRGQCRDRSNAASVGKIADNLIAAGYQIRIDALIEDRRDYPRIAVLTLGQQTSVSGRGLIRTLSVN